MRTIVAALAAGAALASAPALARPAPDVQLAQLLEGRTAGKPERCINLRNIRATHIIDKTAIVYEVGGTRYVNRPDGGATSLNDWDVLVTDTHSPQLCSIDVVRLYDRTNWFPKGFVSLGEFVPYRKAPKAD